MCLYSSPNYDPSQNIFQLDFPTVASTFCRSSYNQAYFQADRNTCIFCYNLRLAWVPSSICILQDIPYDLVLDGNTSTRFCSLDRHLTPHSRYISLLKKSRSPSKKGSWCVLFSVLTQLVMAAVCFQALSSKCAFMSLCRLPIWVTFPSGSPSHLCVWATLCGSHCVNNILWVTLC